MFTPFSCDKKLSTNDLVLYLQLGKIVVMLKIPFAQVTGVITPRKATNPLIFRLRRLY